MKRITAMILTVAMLLTLAMLPASAESKGTIKLGGLAPLTGNYAEYGKGFQIAWQMAIDEINAAGGANGYQLSIDVKDTQGDPVVSSTMATSFAEDDEILAMLMKNLVQIVFGPEQKPVINIINNTTYTMNIGSVAVDFKLLQIVVMMLVVLFAVSLTLFFNRTRWGVALRAVSQNKQAAYIMGINVKRTAMLGNCIGCGFGGIAGILLSIYYYTVSSTIWGNFSMKAFSASVLGGLVDLRLSALGGLCMGVIENLGITVSSATFRDVFSFGFLILMLVIRPQGFAAKKGSRV